MGKTHWLTAVSLAVCSIALVVLIHEAVHALFCLILGGEIRHFSATHINCSCDAAWKFKVVAASGSLSNLLLAGILWPILRRIADRDGRQVFFVWLFFFMNLSVGTGYWFASGVANTGDWARVITGWEPRWVYQLGLLLLGTVTLMVAVAWALVEFGRILSDDAEKPIGQAQEIATVAYFSAFAVMLLIGTVQPGGPFSTRGMSGMIAVLGGLSPMLWMMQWFRADMFKLRATKPLTIERSTLCVVFALIAIATVIGITIIGRP